MPLALACGISLSIPGEYSIIFSVTNSAGLSANTTRQLVVKAVCPEGESLCDDKVRIISSSNWGFTSEVGLLSGGAHASAVCMVV